MFWESIGSGLSVLTHWETYAAGLLFLVLSTGPVILFSVIASKSGKGSFAMGCLSVLVLPFFQVFALVVFVFTMAPIILGLSGEAAWRFPWMLTAEAPWSVAKFVGLLLLAALVLTFIPIIGQLQSLHTMLLGGLALILVLGLMRTANPEWAAKRVHVWPGFWFTVGLLVVGASMAWIGRMLAAALSIVIYKLAEGVGHIVLLPVAGVFGFFPVFIYGAWLGASFRTR